MSASGFVNPFANVEQPYRSRQASGDVAAFIVVQDAGPTNPFVLCFQLAGGSDNTVPLGANSAAPKTLVAKPWRIRQGGAGGQSYEAYNQGETIIAFRIRQRVQGEACEWEDLNTAARHWGQ